MMLMLLCNLSAVNEKNFCFNSQVNARKHSPAILAAAISAWSFILTTVDGWRLNFKYCRG